MNQLYDCSDDEAQRHLLCSNLLDIDHELLEQIGAVKYIVNLDINRDYIEHHLSFLSNYSNYVSKSTENYDQLIKYAQNVISVGIQELYTWKQSQGLLQFVDCDVRSSVFDILTNLQQNFLFEHYKHFIFDVNNQTRIKALITNCQCSCISFFDMLEFKMLLCEDYACCTAVVNWLIDNELIEQFQDQVKDIIVGIRSENKDEMNAIKGEVLRHCREEVRIEIEQNLEM